MVDGQPNSHLVRDLCGESQYLTLLRQTFSQKFAFEDYRIISIYETMDTKTVQVNIASWTLLVKKTLKVLENTWHRKMGPNWCIRAHGYSRISYSYYGRRPKDVLRDVSSCRSFNAGQI